MSLTMVLEPKWEVDGIDNTFDLRAKKADRFGVLLLSHEAGNRCDTVTFTASEEEEYTAPSSTDLALLATYESDRDGLESLRERKKSTTINNLCHSRSLNWLVGFHFL